VSKDRADLWEKVEELKILVRRAIQGIKEAKEASFLRMEKEKQIAVYLDRTGEILEMKLNALESVTPERFGSVGRPSQEEIRRHKENAVYLGGSLDALASDSSWIVKGLGIVVAIAGTIEAVAVSGDVGFSIAYVDKETRNEWERRIAHLLPVNIDSVARELGLVDRTLEANFLRVTGEWSAARDDEKYAILLALRSVIFNQFLGKFYDRVRFSRAGWYSKGMEKWHCSTKLLIQGIQDDSNFSGPVLDAINKTASELTRCFHELSKLGKEGGNPSHVEGCYRDTIVFLANALRLRTEILHLSPSPE